MNGKHVWIGVIGATLLLALAGYLTGRDDDLRVPLETRVKLQFLESATYPEATPLTTVRELSLDGDRKMRGGHPSNITLLDDGSILATDSGHHTVYLLRQNESSWDGPIEQSFGEMINPTLIETRNDEIWIKDRLGLNVFAPDGSVIRQIRVFLSFFSMAFSPDGHIFVNPSFRNSPRSRPLVFELDESGGKRKEIGLTDSGPSHRMDDEAFVAASEDSVFVAYSRRPLVQGFSRDSGESIFESVIQHPGFDGLGALRADPSFSHPRKGVFNAPRYLAGTRWKDQSLFVLLHLPFQEIVEMDPSGTVIGCYRRAQSPTALHYFGFQVQKKPSGNSFRIGFIDSRGTIRLVELDQEKSNQTSTEVN